MPIGPIGAYKRPPDIHPDVATDGCTRDNLPAEGPCVCDNRMHAYICTEAAPYVDSSSHLHSHLLIPVTAARPGSSPLHLSLHQRGQVSTAEAGTPMRRPPSVLSSFKHLARTQTQTQLAHAGTHGQVVSHFLQRPTGVDHAPQCWEPYAHLSNWRARSLKPFFPAANSDCRGSCE